MWTEHEICRRKQQFYLGRLQQHSSESTADLHGMEQQVFHQSFKPGTSNRLVAPVTSRLKSTDTFVTFFTNITTLHKNRLMHTFIINATLSTLCHSDKFQPSKGHLHWLRLIHFNNRVKKISHHR